MWIQNFTTRMPWVDQLLLEVRDFAVPAHVLGLGGEAFDAFDEHAAVPAPIEDRDAAGTRQVPPEPPEIVMRPFLVGGRRDRDHLIVPRVEAAGDASNRAALAGGVPALEHDNRRDAALAGSALKRVEACLLLGELTLEVGIAQRQAEIEVVEHVELPLDALQRVGRLPLRARRSAGARRGAAPRTSIETAANGVAQLGGDDDGPVALVFAFDDVPGRLSPCWCGGSRGRRHSRTCRTSASASTGPS